MRLRYFILGSKHRGGTCRIEGVTRCWPVRSFRAGELERQGNRLPSCRWPGAAGRARVEGLRLVTNWINPSFSPSPRRLALWATRFARSRGEGPGKDRCPCNSSERYRRSTWASSPRASVKCPSHFGDGRAQHDPGVVDGKTASEKRHQPAIQERQGFGHEGRVRRLGPQGASPSARSIRPLAVSWNSALRSVPSSSPGAARPGASPAAARSA